MTDSKLRELERIWKESGSVEDEARYLLERVRVGDLSQERLELAAYCRHEGALAALGSLPKSDVSSSYFEQWYAGLSGVSASDLGRVALAIAEYVVDKSPQCTEELADYAREMITAVREFFECPCEGHATGCVLRARSLKTPAYALLGALAAVPDSVRTSPEDAREAAAAVTGLAAKHWLAESGITKEELLAVIRDRLVGEL